MVQLVARVGAVSAAAAGAAGGRGGGGGNGGGGGGGGWGGGGRKVEEDIDVAVISWRIERDHLNLFRPPPYYRTELSRV